MKKNEVDHFVLSSTKNNSKCINDLNIRAKLLKSLLKHMCTSLLLGLSNQFFDLITKAEATKENPNCTSS